MLSTAQAKRPMTSTGALRVTVLAGGPSAERAVSLDSGNAIAAALRRRGHDVFLSDISPQNLVALDHAADVVFPALHGSFGEDGTVQRLLEQRGLPFVGSDSRASSIAIDKIETKRLAFDLDIPTPPFEERARSHPRIDELPMFGAPLVVKPVDQGSSVATSLVKSAAEFAPALKKTMEHFDRALVERFIAGDELTVGILGGVTLPPICIRPKRSFYDYAAKYEDDATEYLFDAGLPERTLIQVQEWSRRIFNRLGARHLARIDWMVERETGSPWFLEVNTLPGFTSHSLVPKAAAKIGIEFDELCERLVRMALETRA